MKSSDSTTNVLPLNGQRLSELARNLHAKNFATIPTGRKGTSDKAPLISGWQTRLRGSRFDQMDVYDQPKTLGVGVITGHDLTDTGTYLIGIDIDSYDEQLSKRMLFYITELLGFKPAYRVGKPPKFLIPALVDQSMTKLQSIRFSDNSCLEILAKGQQFVAYGRHRGNETGWYQWVGGTLDFDSLPKLTIEDCHRLIATFERFALEAGLTPQTHSAGQLNANGSEFDPISPTNAFSQPLTDLNDSEVRNLVFTFEPPVVSYDEWIAMGQALHHQYRGAQQGLELWDEWSQLDPIRYRSGDCKSRWKGFGRNTVKRPVTLRTFIECYNRSARAPVPMLTLFSPIEMTPLGHSWYRDEPEPVEFALEPIFPKDAVSLIIGAGGTGKSMVGLYTTLSMAAGKRILGCAPSYSKVCYISLEDPQKQIRNRLHKMREHFSEDDKERIAENVFLIDRYGKPTHLVFESGGEVVSSPLLRDMIDALLIERFDAIIIDTLVRSHSLNENDNGQMSALLTTLECMAAKTGAAVVLLHHVAKRSTGGTASNESHIARGAGAITDNARSALAIEKLPSTGKPFENLTLEYREAAKEGRLLILEHRKHNYSAKHPTQYLLIGKNGVPEALPYSTMLASPEEEKAEAERRMDIVYTAMYQWFRESKFDTVSPSYIKEHFSEISDFLSQGISDVKQREAGDALKWAYSKKLARIVSNKNGRHYQLDPPEEFM